MAGDAWRGKCVNHGNLSRHFLSWQNGGTMENVNDFESLAGKLRSVYRRQGPAAQSENLMAVYRWYFDGKISFNMKLALLKENDRLLARYVQNEI